MTEHLTGVVIDAGDSRGPWTVASRVAARLGRRTTTSWSRTTRRLVGTVALVPVVLVAGALAGCTPTPGGTASVGPFSENA